MNNQTSLNNNLEHHYVRPTFSEYKKEFNPLIEAFKCSNNTKEQLNLFYQINNLKKKYITNSYIAVINHFQDTTSTYWNTEYQNQLKFDIQFNELNNDFYRLILCETKYKFLYPILGKNTLQTINYKINEQISGLPTLLESEKKLADKITHEILPQSKFNEEKNELEIHLEKLIKIRNSIAKKLGRENFIDIGFKRQGRYYFTPSDIKIFTKNIKDYFVPIYQDIIENQKKRLNKKTLFFDEESKFYNDNLWSDFFKNNKAKSLLKEHLISFSPETKEFYHFMNQHQLINIDENVNKAKLSFSTFLPALKFPFFMGVTTHTAFDMITYIHEAGHAFKFYLNKEEEIVEHSNPSHELAETHSIAFELISYQNYDNILGEIANKYRYYHMSKVIYLLLLRSALEEFQLELYQVKDISLNKLNKIWMKIEKDYFPHRKYRNSQLLENGGFWQNMIHIYSYPFYMIEYPLAIINALSIFKTSTNNWEDGWYKYLDFCKYDGKKSNLELVKELSLHHPFKKSDIKELSVFLRKWTTENMSI